MSTARWARRLEAPTMRMPGTLLTIWLVRPWPMKPAPMLATRIGRPTASRAFSAVSTMIMVWLHRHRQAHSRLDVRFLCRQERPGLVLLRDHADRQRPLQPQFGIAVEQTALGAGGVELAHLVAGLGLVDEHLVTVGKALGHVESPVIVF